MRQRRSKQCHYPTAQNLLDATVVAVDGLDQEL
jgi:hypothetical protein